MIEDQTLEVDVCIAGTGLIECLVALGLTCRGYRILHFDVNDIYGGNSSTLSFRDIINWSNLPNQKNTNIIPKKWNETHSDENKLCIQSLNDEENIYVMKCHDESSIIDKFPPKSCFNNIFTQFLPFHDTKSDSEVKSEKKNTTGIDDVIDHDEIFAVKDELINLWNRFYIDITPKYLYCKSNFIDLLVNTKLSNNLEFRLLENLSLLLPNDRLGEDKIENDSHNEILNTNEQESSSNTLLKTIPFSKNLIFTDKSFTLFEKHTLTKLVKSITADLNETILKGVDKFQKNVPNTEYDVNLFSDSAHLGINDSSLSKSHHDNISSNSIKIELKKLSNVLSDCIIYGICQYDEFKDFFKMNEEEQEEFKRRIIKCVSSLNIYSDRSPFIYPCYGIGDILQAITRFCSVHGAIYILRTRITKFLFNKNELNAKNCLSIREIHLSTGQKILTKYLFTNLDNIPSLQTLVDISQVHNPNHSELNSSKSVPFHELIGAKFLIESHSLLSEFSYSLDNDRNYVHSSISGFDKPEPVEKVRDTCVTPNMKNGIICRMVVITRSSLMGSNGFHTLVIPPSLLGPNRIVRVIQADKLTGCCPDDFYITYFAHIRSNSSPCIECNDIIDSENRQVKQWETAACSVLVKAFKILLRHSNADARDCLFCCSYQVVNRINHAQCKEMFLTQNPEFAHSGVSTDEGSIQGSGEELEIEGLSVIPDSPTIPSFSLVSEPFVAADIIYSFLKKFGSTTDDCIMPLKSFFFKPKSSEYKEDDELNRIEKSDESLEDMDQENEYFLSDSKNIGINTSQGSIFKFGENLSELEELITKISE